MSRRCKMVASPSCSISIASFLKRTHANHVSKEREPQASGKHQVKREVRQFIWGDTELQRYCITPQPEGVHPRHVSTATHTCTHCFRTPLTTPLWLVNTCSKREKKEAEDVSQRKKPTRSGRLRLGGDLSGKSNTRGYHSHTYM